MSAAERWDALRARCAEIDQLRAITSVLGWDQQTYLPPKAGPARGDQLALLARLHHERLADPRLGELLARLADDELDRKSVV